MSNAPKHDAPICSRCNDTHMMSFQGGQAMCTSCPRPCKECRAGGNGPFCDKTPCSCACHEKHHQYAGRRSGDVRSQDRRCVDCAITNAGHRVPPDGHICPHAEPDPVATWDAWWASRSPAAREAAMRAVEEHEQRSSEARSDERRGLYGKYRVERRDGSSGPGGKHEHCEYFVLDLAHDKYAFPALLAYASACQDAYPELAADLRRRSVGERSDELAWDAMIGGVVEDGRGGAIGATDLPLAQRPNEARPAATMSLSEAIEEMLAQSIDDYDVCRICHGKDGGGKGHESNCAVVLLAAARESQRTEPARPQSTVDDWTRAAKWIDAAGDARAIGHYREPDARRMLAEEFAQLRAEERAACISEVEGEAAFRRSDVVAASTCVARIRLRSGERPPNDGTRPPAPLADDEMRTCWCFRCINAPELGIANPTMQRMITCPACGNKRCPRATDHRYACTGSNEPGQFGSRYGALAGPTDTIAGLAEELEWQERVERSRGHLRGEAGTVTVKDFSGNGLGPWRLFLGEHGIADWPGGQAASSDPKAYAEEVARCVRVALEDPAHGPCVTPSGGAAEQKRIANQRRELARANTQIAELQARLHARGELAKAACAFIDYARGLRPETHPHTLVGFMRVEMDLKHAVDVWRGTKPPRENDEIPKAEPRGSTPALGGVDDGREGEGAGGRTAADARVAAGEQSAPDSASPPNPSTDELDGLRRAFDASVWCLSELQAAEKNVVYARATLIANLKDRLQAALRMGPYEERSRA